MRREIERGVKISMLWIPGLIRGNDLADQAAKNSAIVRYIRCYFVFCSPNP